MHIERYCSVRLICSSYCNLMCSGIDPCLKCAIQASFFSCDMLDNNRWSADSWWFYIWKYSYCGSNLRAEVRCSEISLCTISNKILIFQHKFTHDIRWLVCWLCTLLGLKDSETSLGSKSQPKRHIQCTSLARWHSNTGSRWHRRCASVDMPKNRWYHSKHYRGYKSPSRIRIEIQASNWEEACSWGCPGCPSGQHLPTLAPSDYQPIGWHEENCDHPWRKLH